MRLWTLHPKYLDARGLVALWREALLAQKVLAGRTQGYRSHPQLIRFREQEDPLSTIASYLTCVHEEAVRRGYHFNASRIRKGRASELLKETDGQLLFEWAHLKRKLQSRDTKRLGEYCRIARPQPHPLFLIVKGSVRGWEKLTSPEPGTGPRRSSPHSRGRVFPHNQTLTNVSAQWVSCAKSTG